MKPTPRSTHRRRIVLAAGGVALCSALPAAAGFNLWTNEYTLSLQELQAALQRKFPYNYRYKLLVDVRLTNPKLRLDATNNRVTTEMDATINNPLMLDQPFNGTLALNSGLRYDSAQRAVLLEKPAVERFDVEGMPAQYSRKMNKIGSVLAEELLHGYPLYTFKPDQLRFRGLDFEPGTITVLSDGISVQVVPR